MNNYEMSAIEMKKKNKMKEKRRETFPSLLQRRLSFAIDTKRDRETGVEKKTFLKCIKTQGRISNETLHLAVSLKCKKGLPSHVVEEKKSQWRAL